MFYTKKLEDIRVFEDKQDRLCIICRINRQWQMVKPLDIEDRRRYRSFMGTWTEWDGLLQTLAEKYYQDELQAERQKDSTGL